MSVFNKKREILSARASLIRIAAIKNEIDELKKELFSEAKKSIEKIDKILIILRCQNRHLDLDLYRLISQYDEFDIKNNYKFYSEDPENKCKNLKKEILKFKKEEVDKLELSINTLMLKELLVNQKSLLERLYFTGAIILGSLPILSLLGLFTLLIYLNQIDSTLYFMEIAVDGGIWFSIALGGTIFLTQLLSPCIIVFSQSENRKNIDVLYILFFYLVSIVISVVGFYIFYNEYFSLAAAIFWHIFIILISRSYKKSLQIREVGRGVKFFGIVVLFLPIFIFTMSSIIKGLDYPVYFRLHNVLRVIGFSQSDYSWFKVNNTYFERTGLPVKYLKDKENQFSDIRNVNLVRTGDDVFLYGKLWVNSTKIKIICPPDKFNDKYSPIDIKAEEVRQKCIQFQAGDLQNLMGLVSPVKIEK